MSEQMEKKSNKHLVTDVGHVNHAIFDAESSVAGLHTEKTYSYDRELVSIRHSLLRQHAYGKERVLDLGCGTGVYLLPLLGRVSTAIGVDFSKKMLDALSNSPDSTGRAIPVQADARFLPFADKSLDVVFSFCAMYYVPDVHLSINEVSRILRPGGVAILELGNSQSLNSPVNMQFHRKLGWAKPAFAPLPDLLASLRDANLHIFEHRVFQLFPMYGTPEGMRYLVPFTSSRLKYFMGIKIGSRMLDEWISSLSTLRKMAFRHMIVAIKK